MRRISFILFTALFALGARAEDIPPSPIVKTRLLVDAPSLNAHRPPSVGVEFTIPQHWHIYWRNPGDSGIPTTLGWSLPPGVKAGPIRWPAPERLEVSGLVNYGYSGKVVLAVPLSGHPLSGPISVKARWLVCKDICIPESAELKGVLPGNASEDARKIHAYPAPITEDADGEYWVDGKQVHLRLHVASVQKRALGAVHWFPIEDGVIANAAPQKLLWSKTSAATGGGVELEIVAERGEADELPKAWSGVLRIEARDEMGPRAYAVTTHHRATALAQEKPDRSLMGILLLAFFGGLILNIMPCVLPILALKALAIAHKARAARLAAIRQGIAYTGGVVASFLAIAAVMLSLKASGNAIGWGFQLQNLGFVLFLAFVMLAVGANLLGLFSLPVLFGTKAHGIDENSPTGSFFTGALAVLVATPCSAPFMATAIGATLALPTASALLVFAFLGLGMASPFLLISLWPAARRLLPNPGRWMHRLKQWLALPMFATALWLFSVAFAMQAPVKESENRYTAERLAALRAAKKPVLVDATAAWCLSCKVNERVALKPASMQAFFAQHQVSVLVADWTNNDPAITAYLASFGRNGVPLYVYYPPGGDPVVLPQILTPTLVREAIARKG